LRPIAFNQDVERLADEGIDLEPAAAVAAASPTPAVAGGRLGRRDLVLLNVTGGGHERLRRDLPVRLPAPDAVVDAGGLDALAALL
jgi:cysteate synthase